MTDRELMQQALEALELHAKQYPHMQKGYTVDAITALREALAEQPEQQEPVGHGGRPMTLRECMEAEQPAQQEPDRVKFERHWRKTRGEKKANRELPRHPLQPQTYIQDSANRHWVTWQAAVRSVSPPASKPWVGLTDEDRALCVQATVDSGDAVQLMRAIEAKLREKNA